MEYFSKIVHIDADEYAHSIIERFLPLEDSDIIFAVPSKSRIFQNISELKLLKQAVDSSGKNIVLVSQDETGLGLAHDIGFQVEREFLELLSPEEDTKYLAKTHPHPRISDIISSVPLNKMTGPMYSAPLIEEQQSKEFKEIIKNKTTIHGKKKFPVLIAIAVFIVVSLIIGGISLATLLPYATIKITSKEETVVLDLSIIADKVISQTNIVQNQIPLQIITVEKEKTSEFSATGKSDAPAKASGKIIVFNNQSVAQPLIAGTRFESADGKIFKISTMITVPANGSLEATVVAAEKGSQYNIGPGEFTLPAYKGGSKFSLVYGKSETVMQGGTDKEGSAVSSDDIENAKKNIKEQLTKEAIDELLKEKEKLPQAGILTFLEQAQFVKVINEKVSAIAGTSAEKFFVTTKISLSAFLFQEKSVDDIIEENVKTKIAQSQVDFGVIRKNYSDIKTDFDAGTLSFKVKAEQDIASTFNVEELQKLFAGKNGEQIREYILENNAMEGAEISFWPFWVKKAPKNPEKIEIVY